MIGFGIALITIAALHYATNPQVSPDGRIYLRAAKGEPTPLPFHLRSLAPLVLRENFIAWRIATAVSLCVTAISIGLLAHASGLTWAKAGIAAALFGGLAITRTLVELPVLVDAPALALTALGAALESYGFFWVAIIVVCIGAAIKEHVPVFAALAVLQPWFLIALAVPLIRYTLKRPAQPETQSQTNPIAYARTKQAQRLFRASDMLLPWGACLAFLFAPTLPALLSVIVAYGMLITASDSTRIYQWACIPVCVAAASVIPVEWAAPVLAVHIFNPFEGEK